VVDPPAAPGCLPGVERGVLRERVLYPSDLTQASGIAVVSALRSWQAAAMGQLATSAAPSAHQGTSRKER
jgi:hypothetical protein